VHLVRPAKDLALTAETFLCLKLAFLLLLFAIFFGRRFLGGFLVGFTFCRSEVVGRLGNLGRLLLDRKDRWIFNLADFEGELDIDKCGVLLFAHEEKLLVSNWEQVKLRIF